jgi:hypothetical protein
VAELAVDRLRQIAVSLRESDLHFSEHEIAVIAWARATGADENLAWATWCSGLNSAPRLVPRQRTGDRIEDLTGWNCGVAPAPVTVLGGIGVP